MRSVFATLLGLVAAGAASAQPAAAPASAPASAPIPATAASRAVPVRNPAVVAAENAKEPGAQRPEERVIPQLSVPLQSRRNAALAAAAASAPPGSVPGAVNDGAARCLAARSASERAACERGLPASAPVKPTR
jgi:hypothetical protein